MDLPMYIQCMVTVIYKADTCINGAMGIFRDVMGLNFQISEPRQKFGFIVSLIIHKEWLQRVSRSRLHLNFMNVA